MTLAEFKNTVLQSDPAPTEDPALQALWWAAKRDWNRAHKLVQDQSSRDAAWVHAYLHRLEGDLSNAHYWYRQARRAAASGPLEAEWDAIATALLAAIAS
jgi:hypothetical protein